MTRRPTLHLPSRNPVHFTQELNMDKIIVYLDDAAYAQQQLAPLQAGNAPQGAGATTHWILVACAPRMTQHISKWVSHSARQNWRAKWAENLFQGVVPQLREAGDEVTTLLAKGSLPALSQQLAAQHQGARVVDARRPKFGQQLPPVTAGQRTDDGRGWEVPGAVAGMGAMLVLAAE
jgi:hypothetical protein